MVNSSKVPEFIDNDNVVMSIYRDELGALYVGVHDKVDETKKIVLTAEAMYKLVSMVDGMFDQKKNSATSTALN